MIAVSPQVRVTEEVYEDLKAVKEALKKNGLDGVTLSGVIKLQAGVGILATGALGKTREAREKRLIEFIQRIINDPRFEERHPGLLERMHKTLKEKKRK